MELDTYVEQFRQICRARFDKPEEWTLWSRLMEPLLERRGHISGRKLLDIVNILVPGSLRDPGYGYCVFSQVLCIRGLEKTPDNIINEY